MGKCKYCGQDAGFFRSKHDECEKKHRQGLAAIKQIISSCFVLKEEFLFERSRDKANSSDLFYR